jgi:eukaryotic translation initiation factor 2C
MVVGVDTTHPAPGSGSDAKSIAAVMASTGIDFAQFSGCIRIQTGRVEMVEKLSMMMRARLELWEAKNNNVLPDRVVLFRDGVSEGQLETVLDKKKSQLDVLFGEMYRSKGKPIPKLTIIVVDKRHHIGFYQERIKSTRIPRPEQSWTRWSQYPGTWTSSCRFITRSKGRPSGIRSKLRPW